MKNCASIFFFIAILLVSTLIYAQESSVPEMPFPDVAVPSRTHRPKSKKEAVEALEAYFIEQVFAQGFSMKSMSLLTEEEKKELPYQVDSSYEEEIMKKELSRVLAKRDILGLRKTILRGIDN